MDLDVVVDGVVDEDGFVVATIKIRADSIGELALPVWVWLVVALCGENMCRCACCVVLREVVDSDSPVTETRRRVIQNILASLLKAIKSKMGASQGQKEDK